MKLKLFLRIILIISPALTFGMEQEEAYHIQSYSQPFPELQIQIAKQKIEQIFIEAVQKKDNIYIFYKELAKYLVSLDFINPRNVLARDQLVECIKNLQNIYYPRNNSKTAEELTIELYNLAVKIQDLFETDKEEYENAKLRMAELTTNGANPNVCIEKKCFFGEVAHLPLLSYLEECYICGNLTPILVIYGADMHYANEKARINPPIVNEATNTILMFKLTVIFGGIIHFEDHAPELINYLSQSFDEELLEFLLKNELLTYASNANFITFTYFHKNIFKILLKILPPKTLQNLHDKAGWTYLHLACKNNDYMQVDILLNLVLKDTMNNNDEFGFDLTTDSSIKELLLNYNEYPDVSDSDYDMSISEEESDYEEAKNRCEEEYEKEQHATFVRSELEQQDSEKITLEQEIEHANQTINLEEELKSTPLETLEEKNLLLPQLMSLLERRNFKALL